jgi:hypothetical protein
LREYDPETLLSTSYSQTTLIWVFGLLWLILIPGKRFKFKFSFKNLERENISTLHYMETFAYTLLQKFEKMGSFLRASPGVLTMDIKNQMKRSQHMWPWTLESDEEKSTYAGLIQENGFSPADLLSLLRLVKSIAKLCNS